MTRLLLIVAVAVVAIAPTTAFAVSVDIKVDSENMESEKFSVKAAKQDDGRIEFTITRKLDRPLYFISDFKLRKAGEIIAETRQASGPTEGTETWHLTVSQEHVSGSVFHYTENTFPHNGRMFPVPGGIFYRIRLRDFPIAEMPAQE